MSTPVVVNPFRIIEDGYGHLVGVTPDGRLKVQIEEFPSPHATTHISGGSDEIDGDLLDIDFDPQNYTQDTSPPEVSNIDELTSHLKGIDNELGALFEYRLGQGEAIQSILKDLDGYATSLDLSDLETGFNDLETAFQQNKTEQGEVNDTILTSLDGYALQIDLNGLNTTVEENNNQVGEAINIITKDLDGYAALTHAITHISGGSDEVDGDQLDIDYVPINYTRDPTSPQATINQHLTAHLKGIDNAVGSVTDNNDAQAEAINIIRNDLDGYALDVDLQTTNTNLSGLDLTVTENNNQQSQINQSILQALDGYATATTDAFSIFAIWAEENGGLSNNNRQWSFGNGSTGDNNIVIPVDCELFAVTISAESQSGGGVTINVLRNEVTVTTPNFTTNDSVVSLPVPIAFTAGQRIGFETAIETGTWNDVRVCAWFRRNSTAASNAVLNDLLDVSTSGVSTGDILIYDGVNFIPASFIEEFTDAFNPFKNEQSEINDTILAALDGYALQTDLDGLNTTVEENKNQQSQINQDIINSLDGYQFVPNFQFAESEPDSTTTSTTYQLKVSLTTPSLPSGTYYLTWYSEARAISPDDGAVQMRLQQNNTTDIAEVELFTGSVTFNRLEDFQVFSGHKVFTSLSGVQTFDIDYRDSPTAGDAGTVAIRRARLTLWRVG